MKIHGQRPLQESHLQGGPAAGALGRVEGPPARSPRVAERDHDERCLRGSPGAAGRGVAGLRCGDDGEVVGEVGRDAEGGELLPLVEGAGLGGVVVVVVDVRALAGMRRHAADGLVLRGEAGGPEEDVLRLAGADGGELGVAREPDGDVRVPRTEARGDVGDGGVGFDWRELVALAELLDVGDAGAAAAVRAPLLHPFQGHP